MYLAADLYDAVKKDHPFYSSLARVYLRVGGSYR